MNTAGRPEGGAAGRGRGLLWLVAAVAAMGLVGYLAGRAVDPAGRIVAALEAAGEYSGRRIVIGEQLHWGLLPRPYLEVEALRVSSRPGFVAEPMIEAPRARLSFRWTDLLRGRLDAPAMELERPIFRFGRDAAGDGALADVAARMATRSGLVVPDDPLAVAGGLAMLAAGGGSIADGQFDWSDAFYGRQLVFERLQLEGARDLTGASAEFNLRATLRGDFGDVGIDSSGRLLLQPGTIHAVRDLRLELTHEVGTALLRAGAVDAGEEGTIEVRELSLETTWLSGDGRLALADGAVSGRIAVGLRDSAGLFELLDVDVSPFDQAALNELRAWVEFGGNLERMRIAAAAVEGPGGVLTGTAELVGGERPQLLLNLAAESFDLDALLTPEHRQSLGLPAPLLLPAPLWWRDGSFSAHFGRLRAGGLVHDELSLRAEAADGIIRLEDFRSSVAGGGLELSGSLSRAEPASLAVTGAATGLQADRLTAGRGLSNTVSGILDAEIRASALVSVEGVVPASIDGVVRGTLTSAQVDGFDLGAILGALQGATVPAGAGTRIEQAGISIAAERGVARSDDLSVVGSGFRITGRGVLNLASGAIDYLAEVAIGDAPSGAILPLRLQGPLQAPAISLDMNRLMRAGPGSRP